MLRLLRLALFLSLLFAPSVATAGAQEKVRFDPETHLEGYREARASESRASYNFAAFEALRGKDVSTEQLKELREVWRREKENVAARRTAKPVERRPESNPFEEALAKHAHFKTLAFHPSDGHADLPIYVQRMAKEPPNYVRTETAFHRAWIDKIAAIFDEGYAGPMHLERRADRAQLPVIVLATPGDYGNYARARRDRGYHTAYGAYDEGLHAVVTYRETGPHKRPAFRRRYGALSDVVLGLLAAHSAPGVEVLEEVWFTEGLAAYLAFHLGRSPEALDERVPHRTGLQALEAVLSDGQEAGYWLSLPTLLSIRGYGGLSRFVASEAKKRRVETNDLLWMFEAQTALWLHYLHEGEQRLHQQRAWDYLQLVLEDRGNARALKETLGVELDVLERNFKEYVRATSRKVKDTSESESAEVADAPELAAPPEPRFDPRELDVELDAERRLALALATASRGGLVEAREILSAVESAGKLSARVERASQRIEALIAARDAYLAGVAQARGRLRLPVGEERVNVKVEGFADGVITFGRNKAGLEELRVAELAPDVLATAAGKKLAEAGEPWVRSYALALGGDERWRRYLGDGEADRDLAKDVEGGLAGRVEAGSAIAKLRALAGGALPESEGAADEVLATVSGLVALGDRVGCVAEKREALRGLATEALGVLFPVRGLGELLNGGLEVLGEGRVRVSYEFDAVQEAWDFVEDREYLSTFHEQLGKGKGKGKDAPTLIPFRSGGGALEGSGWTTHRHVLGFERPLVVRYALKHVDEGKTSDVGRVMVGIHDDEKGSYVGCMGFGVIKIEDVEGRRREYLGEGRFEFVFDRAYAVEFRSDRDGGLEASVDGVVMAGGSHAGLSGGRVFVWVHSEYPVAFERLEIEGRVSEEYSRGARGIWVERRLAEMGF